MVEIDFQPLEEPEIGIDFEPLEEPAKPIEMETEKQAVSPLTRAGLKNLIGDSPKLQQEYLERKGFDTKMSDGRLRVRKKGEKDWGVVDPKGFDLQDVTDVVGDVVEVVATGIAALFGGSVAGPVGGFAAAGAATGAVETGRQALAKSTGFREEYDPSEIAKQTAIGTAAPALIGAGGMIAKPFIKAGQTAAGRTMHLGTRAISKIGPDKFRELGQFARKEGLADIFTGVEATAKKAAAKAAELGKTLESQYKQLDSKVVSRIPAKDLVQKLSDQSAKKFPDPRQAKTVQRELSNLLSTKKDMKPSDLWDLAKELNTRAGTFTKPGGNQDFTKAGLLEEAANTIRGDLRQMAKTHGMSSIPEASARFHKLKVVEDAMDAKLAGQLGKSSTLGTQSIKERAYDVISDITNKSISKVGGMAEKTVPLVPKAQAASAVVPSIADRIKEQ